MGAALLGALPLGALLAAVAALGVGFFVLVRPLERVESRHAALQRHLADVSHDLKTPISSLHLALEQALEDSKEPALRPLLASAMNDAVYLAALTSNLRLASEMRDGWSPAGPGASVDLTDVATRVVTRARFFAKQRGLTLEVAVPDNPTMAGCDALAAEQALSNVIENALTHGEAGGHVAVVLETSAASFTLTVADDGPGIAPAELPRLGERTFRSDAARQRDPRGSGLGVAITNEVCARCGWTLSFEAEEPHGLRVTMAGPMR
jgi:signal transduction histidine kinase